MTITRPLVFLIAAAVCFAVALLIATGIVTSTHEQAFVDGRLLSFVLGHIL